MAKHVQEDLSMNKTAVEMSLLFNKGSREALRSHRNLRGRQSPSRRRSIFEAYRQNQCEIWVKRPGCVQHKIRRGLNRGQTLWICCVSIELLRTPIKT